MKNLVLAFLFIFVLFMNARAGECAEQSQKQAYKLAKAVFTGTVTNLSEVKIDQRQAQDNAFNGWGRLYEVQINIDEVWKGVTSEKVSLLVQLGGSEIQLRFGVIEKGDKFLFYATSSDSSDSKLFVGSCSRTSSIEDAKEDLAKLGKGKRFDKPSSK